MSPSRGTRLSSSSTEPATSDRFSKKVAELVWCKNSQVKWSKRFEKPKLPKGKTEFAEEDVVIGNQIPVENKLPKGCTAYEAAVKSIDSSWKWCAVISGSIPDIENKPYFFAWCITSALENEVHKRPIVQLAAILCRTPPEELLFPAGEIDRSNVVLGHYLARGAYSIVYQAVFRVHDKDGNEYWKVCALKLYKKSILKTFPGQQNERQARFQEFVNGEIDSMKAFHMDNSGEYPLAVKLFGKFIGEDYDGQLGIIMQIEDGGNLSQRLNMKEKAEGIWDFQDVIINIFCLSHSLRRLHGLGFLHRDIKPANIIYRPVSWICRPAAVPKSTALPLLADFGLCSSKCETSTMGARNYQPLCVKERKMPCTAKTDTYCLASVLKEIIIRCTSPWPTSISPNEDGKQDSQKTRRTEPPEVRKTDIETVCNTGTPGNTETGPNASEMAATDAFIFQLLPGLKQILSDATRPEAGGDMTSDEFFDRLTSPELFGRHGKSASKQHEGLLIQALRRGQFARILQGLFEHPEAVKSFGSKIPWNYVGCLRSALRRLARFKQEFGRLSKAMKTRHIFRCNRAVRSWCPKLRRFSSLLARFSPALPASAPSSNRLYTYLLTAADLLLIYAFANYILYYNESGQPIDEICHPVTTTQVDGTANSAVSSTTLTAVAIVLARMAHPQASQGFRRHRRHSFVLRRAAVML